VLGKAIEHEYNLAELLRRPDVTYAGLMSLDGGGMRRRPGGVSRETLGGAAVGPHTLFVEPVVEQVEIAPSTRATSTAKKDEVERAAHLRKPQAAAELDYMQVTA
jgi:tRNA uridine 5-carboxymethylaminomethyl modification enzyme